MRFAPLAPIAIALLLAGGPRVGHAQATGEMPGLQLTVFGVLAKPGPGEDDPRLKEVLPVLRNLVPNHSFRLLKVESKRTVRGGSVSCDLGDGFVAVGQVVNPSDVDGKVQIRFRLAVDGFDQYQSVVTTPPNQVVYVNRVLGNGDRLLVGLGAR